jgi:copper transport protein
MKPLSLTRPIRENLVSSLRKFAIGVAVVVGLVTVLPAAASAHAVLLKTTPSSSQSLNAPPTLVQLLFSEPLDPVFSRVAVRDASGQQVDAGNSHVDSENDQLLETSLAPGLPNGVYTVEWRSLSAIDVHPDAGQYSLFVGVPVQANTATATTQVPPTPTPETTLGRWWFYVSASLFGGVLATWKLVLSPLLVDAKPDVRARARRRTYWLIVAGGASLILGTLFSAVAQAAAAANVPLLGAVGAPLGELLLRGRYASIWWPRLGLELASLLLIVSGGIDGLASECALATLPAVLLTSALTSHGAALPNAAGPGIAVDWLHIVGACAWVGGLVALAAFLPTLRAGPDAAISQRLLVARFGRLALVAASLVLLSGVVQGALEVGSVSGLTTTLYGQLLLIKVGLLVFMLLLAGRNEWRVRTASSIPGFTRTRGLSGGISIELALGVLVFGVAALLSSTPPTPSA